MYQTAYLADKLIVFLFESRDPQNIRAFDLNGKEMWTLAPPSRHQPEINYANLGCNGKKLQCSTFDGDVFEIINLEKGYKKYIGWGK